MCLAISAMPYTSMLGVNVSPGSMCLVVATQVAPGMLALLVSLTSLFWFCGGILHALFDQRMARQNAHALAQLEQVHRQALRELEYQKYALDQHSIVAVTDVRGTITYVNDKFCTISQYSRDELLGQNHRLINSGIHPRNSFAICFSPLRGKTWHGDCCNRARTTACIVATTVVPNIGIDGRLQYIAIRADIANARKPKRHYVAAALERTMPS